MMPWTRELFIVDPNGTAEQREDEWGPIETERPVARQREVDGMVRDGATVQKRRNNLDLVNRVAIRTGRGQH